MTSSTWFKWSVVLGFALGGFFDGILLHQILQWHHLLSQVPGVGSLREQVLWDGYFHALMYVVAALGLWGLWRTRSRSDEHGGRAMAGALLIGFGMWHVVDSALSHWLLGIHRIKIDSPNPLVWDLIWFTGFGLVPLFLGWMLLRKPDLGRDGGKTSLHIMTAGLLTGGMAAWSLQPAGEQQFTTVVFAPWIEQREAMNAVMKSGGQLVWTDPQMGVLVLDVPTEKRSHFYRQGALLVSGAGLPNGCFNWSRT